ncbi:MAG: hypothetical protein G01um101418_38 [Parcubacteria group bacterium Gr01-1014_18]|nr:MAG: hypothetical protein Greene041636_38 [Parcubacteria group bacterium Greene0416_36]TSC81544.1 MAG: hypothetical protein G01um101418_38 [Parcubacteria group bacterium Gr01-1014_18]TSC99645.1 MAG: hypothetical protein Greene101420_49 [Parcubacteria group bacterium Greene1014_20]TSD07096.1 MAG: hypothetical protein Greene07142_408 [Parcubacteria group bacterium Greene0714_2]
MIFLKDVFKEDLIMKILAGLGFVLNLILWGFLFHWVDAGWERVPLHYSIYTGIDFLGSGYNIFFLGAFGLGICCLHLFLFFLSRKPSVLSYWLLLSSIFFNILLFVFAVFLRGLISQ